MTHIIVTFNRPEYLELCARSLLETTPSEDRICIWNNASNPETVCAIETVIAMSYHRGVHRIKCYDSDTNWGCAGGRNRAFKMWKGLDDDPFFSMTDDDYYYNPGWLEAIKPYLEMPDVGFWTLHNDFTTDKTKIIRTDGVVELRKAITSSQMIMRKDLYEEIGGYKETGKVMGWISSDFCNRLFQIDKPPVRILTPKQKLVENMDHLHNPKNLRELYGKTGYTAFRKDAKRGRIEVGEGKEYFNGLHQEE